MYPPVFFGLFFRSFCCLAVFSGLFCVLFGTVLLLNSHWFARGVCGVCFRVFFGFLPVFGGFFTGGVYHPSSWGRWLFEGVFSLDGGGVVFDGVFFRNL